MVNLIRPNELITKLKISRSTLWRISTNPASDFPPKINVSNRLVAYDQQLVEEWLANKTSK